jgi:surfactin synthase thioesterase subunit
MQEHFDRPVVVFGHSLGALLGFAFARDVEAHGLGRAAAVVLSGRAPPTAAQTTRRFRSEPELLAILRAWGGTPRPVLENRELLALLLAGFRADVALIDAAASWVSGKIGSPLLVTGGASDPTVAADGLEGWRAWTEGVFELQTFPGEHFYLRQANVALVQRIDRFVRERVEARSVR